VSTTQFWGIMLNKLGLLILSMFQVSSLDT
jgi:hypothetical protein